MTTVIYTAIFGKRDWLRPPRIIERDCKYVCFTDDPLLEQSPWDVRVVPLRNPDPRAFRAVVEAALAPSVGL